MLLTANKLCEDLMSDMPRGREDVIKSDKATYEILEQIGKGSFGAVYRVNRMDDNKELAMKCESFKVKKQVLTQTLIVIFINP
uniref:Protein kinase domain-containing protein n=1 Tax=Heterorhabditis bacteriophora TaxID=37862 RepID=A0A1I7XEU0_HETBA